jgi:hypothetical protein
MPRRRSTDSFGHPLNDRSLDELLRQFRTGVTGTWIIALGLVAILVGLLIWLMLDAVDHRARLWKANFNRQVSLVSRTLDAGQTLNGALHHHQVDRRGLIIASSEPTLVGSAIPSDSATRLLHLDSGDVDVHLNGDNDETIVIARVFSDHIACATFPSDHFFADLAIDPTIDLTVGNRQGRTIYAHDRKEIGNDLHDHLFHIDGHGITFHHQFALGETGDFRLIVSENITLSVVTGIVVLGVLGGIAAITRHRVRRLGNDLHEINTEQKQLIDSIEPIARADAEAHTEYLADGLENIKKIRSRFIETGQIITAFQDLGDRLMKLSQPQRPTMGSNAMSTAYARSSTPSPKSPSSS